jgi:putative restriction endonuclease
MLSAIRGSKGIESDPAGNFEIGCIMLSAPVFLDRDMWIAPPRDWPRSGIMQGKSYDLSHGEGERVWQQCLASTPPGPGASIPAASVGESPGPRYGQPLLMTPRLGQGAFRFAVADAYGRACAVTNEHSRPVLEAAHIQPYAENGPHSVANGLFLRSDIHRLFDKGYVTVSPEDRRFVVSRRLKDDYENGKTYYALEGTVIHEPALAANRPGREYLEWHAHERFRG